jgi:hypothetical protein
VRPTIDESIDEQLLNIVALDPLTTLRSIVPMVVEQTTLTRFLRSSAELCGSLMGIVHMAADAPKDRLMPNLSSGRLEWECAAYLKWRCADRS